MPLRNDWKFTRSLEEVLAAARAKMNQDASRSKFYTNQKSIVMEQLKQQGLKVTEALAAQYSEDVTTFANQRLSVGLDKELQDKVQQCSRKAAEHDTKMREFERWVNLLESGAQDRMLELDFADYSFFFST